MFITYLVPPTLLFLPLSQVVVLARHLGHHLGADRDLPDLPGAVLTWLLMGYFRTDPREVEECALVDGATRCRRSSRIVLPMAIPGIVCAALFGFTLTWNEFTYALTFVSQTANKTAVVGRDRRPDPGRHLLLGIADGGRRSWPACPSSSCYVFFLDYYVSGLTAGAVKG